MILQKSKKETIFFRLFCLALLGKLLLGGLFSSDYQDEMFRPFVSRFLAGVGTSDWNVYQYYYENGLIRAFPYLPLLLFIESAGGALAKVLQLLGVNSIFITNLAFKLPLFLFDLLGYYYLVNMFPEKKHYVIVLYYCSPIVLYACYMHGQLDMVSTVFLLGSLYYLRRIGRHRLGASAMMFSAAFLCKTHVIAVLPFIALYIWHKFGLGKTLRYMLSFLAVTGACIVPFWSEGLLYRVLLNQDQGALLQFTVSIGGVEIYVSLLAVLLIYLAALKIWAFSDDLLVFFCGTIFAIFLAACRPFTGWYVWVVPYIVIFFITMPTGRLINAFTYILLNVFYLVYFVFFHISDYTDLILLGKGLGYLKIDNPFIASVVFTMMSAMLMYLVWQMYSLGIARNPFYRRRGEAFTIGISGDSGSGKSTLVDVLARTLGPRNIQSLEGDGDHKWERGDKRWNVYTHLNPDANYLYRQAQDLITLKSGGGVRRVTYDHSTGRFCEARRRETRRYVLLNGLHSLYLPQLRSHLDFKIYMDTDETLRRYWKLHRDVETRGQDVNTALANIEVRMADAQKYIYPQKQYADMAVRYYDRELHDYMEDSQVVLSAQVCLNAGLNLEPLFQELTSIDVTMERTYSADLTKQIIYIDGRKLQGKQIDYNSIAMRLNPSLDEITVESLVYEENIQGVIALIVLLFIDAKIRGDIS